MGDLIDKLLDRLLPISPEVRLISRCLEQGKVRISMVRWAGIDCVAIEPAVNCGSCVVPGTDAGNLALLLTEEGMYLWDCVSARNDRTTFNLRESLLLHHALDRWTREGFETVDPLSSERRESVK